MIMGIEFTDLAEDVEVLYASDLTPQEVAELELDPAKIENCEDTSQYVRHMGALYPVSDFSADWGITRGTGLPREFAGWDGYLSDSFFSGVVIRYRNEDCTLVDLATFYVRDTAEGGAAS